MKIAYLIIAHEQPELFGRLIDALHVDNVYFFVHIDAKSDEQLFKQAITVTANIKFVTKRKKVVHSGYSLTQAFINTLELAFTHGHHDYYISLSGRDYPIKSNEDIVAFLKHHGQGRNLINFYPLVEGTTLVKNIQKHYYYDQYAKLPSIFLQKAVKKIAQSIISVLPKRQFLPNFVPFRGSVWWCLNQETVSYVIGFINNIENEKFVKFFHSVGASDEILFQTIILNSPLAHTCHNYEQDLLNKSYGEMKNENKVYLHYIDWHPERENPAVLDLNDFHVLTKSDRLFARKFHHVKSSALLDKIDQFRLKRSL